MARAKETEAKRDRALSADHNYEMGSGAVQIAIVLASAAIITNLKALVWIAGGLGIVGAAARFTGSLRRSARHNSPLTAPQGFTY